ncbi:hypothetical protein J2S36_000028 [Arcanobacterium hippocoleae]|uniref:Uncharacterized protein n=1 Tax=Arcanobacterium hippocoleae TaxID=149017 RepID=A0ABU1SZG7_9ACTO|nr:hypothetical protein [Arcanobacterium hippocoleae]MDR6938485.1 hypothetical protein [Arcanobacterium hippocoleae]
MKSAEVTSDRFAARSISVSPLLTKRARVANVLYEYSYVISKLEFSLEEMPPMRHHSGESSIHEDHILVRLYRVRRGLWWVGLAFFAPVTFLYVNDDAVIAFLSGAPSIEAVSPFSEGSWTYTVLASKYLVFSIACGYLSWIANRIIRFVEILRKEDTETLVNCNTRKIIQKVIVWCVTCSVLVLSSWGYFVYGLIYFSS